MIVYPLSSRSCLIQVFKFFWWKDVIKHLFSVYFLIELYHLYLSVYLSPQLEYKHHEGKNQFCVVRCCIHTWHWPWPFVGLKKKVEWMNKWMNEIMKMLSRAVAMEKEVREHLKNLRASLNIQSSLRPLLISLVKNWVCCPMAEHPLISVCASFLVFNIP